MTDSNAATNKQALDALLRETEKLNAAASLENAANRVVDVHKRLIHAVTPGHPGWINAKGPNSTWEDNERYDALFSEWHSASRALRDALGRTGEYA